MNEVLRDPEVASLASREGLAPVTDAARSVLARLREKIGSAHLDAATVDLALTGIPSAVERQVSEAASFHLRPVINATGVILHTNLGRAPLSEAAIKHIQEIACGYSESGIMTSIQESAVPVMCTSIGYSVSWSQAETRPFDSAQGRRRPVATC